MAQDDAKDFFISYNKADGAWAEWIAWQLEDEGYTTTLQAWDFRPGSNFVLQMHKDTSTAQRTIAVLSPSYLEALYTQSEWAAAFIQDPTGEKGTLLPVLIHPCELKGLLAAIVYIDLVDLGEAAARTILLEGINQARAKPLIAPTFPGETAQQPGSSPHFPGTIPSIWNIPYQRNPFFTGRDAVLERIHSVLTSAKTTPIQPQAISGLGGIGKTQIALEYAYRYQREYAVALWVKADSPQVLTADFTNLAQVLNLPQKEEQDQKRLVQAIHSWFNTHTGWLLIFDNIDDPAMLKDFAPSAGTGHILLTTQAQSVRGIARSVPLDKMTRGEGLLFLLQRADILPAGNPVEDASAESRAAAERIVDSMDGHPLALDQAGAYIEETGCSLPDYLHFYQLRKAELLQRRGKVGVDHPASVATTLSLSFKKVTHDNPAAAELLKLFAFLHPDAIPEEFLTEGAAYLGPIFQRLVKDEEQLNTAIGELLKYSLVNRNRAVKTLAIHRLVQLILKSEMNEETQRRWALRAVQVVNKVFQDPEFERWERYWLYTPHAYVCADLMQQWEIVSTEAVALLRRTGTYLQENVLYAEAEPFVKQELKTLYERDPNTNPLEVARSLTQLAALYYDQGKYTEAEPLYRHALAIREHVLGPDHHATAASLNNLALLYYAQGKYAEAEPLHQRALAIREHILGPDHPDTATSLSNLGTLYHDQRKNAEAEPLLQRALAIREHVLGPDHPDTASIFDNLVSFYNEQGKNDQIELLYQAMLATLEKKLGTKHLEVVKILNDLASFYYEHDRYTEAELPYQRALDICEQTFGAEDLTTAFCLNNVAACYDAQGKYAEAEPYYKRALSIREKILGPDHPDVVLVLENYADMLRQMKRKKEAAGLEARIKKIQDFGGHSQ